MHSSVTTERSIAQLSSTTTQHSSGSLRKRSRPWRYRSGSKRPLLLRSPRRQSSTPQRNIINTIIRRTRCAINSTVTTVVAISVCGNSGETTKAHDGSVTLGLGRHRGSAQLEPPLSLGQPVDHTQHGTDALEKMAQAHVFVGSLLIVVMICQRYADERHPERLRQVMQRQAPSHGGEDDRGLGL